MSIIATVESLWRYPVKSMRGEELEETFVGYAGVYGDRVFAFTTPASPKGFPFFTARDQRHMLQYQPRFRHPDKATRPVNQRDAESMGATPIYAEANDLTVEVETPAGKRLVIDDPALMEDLRAGLDDKHQLSLIRSQRALTDCRPLSIFAVQTAHQLADETGVSVEKRRFRANIYLDLTSGTGFGENEFVGRSLRLGEKVIVSILKRDTRCMVITLDPDTAEKTPLILKQIAQAHEGMAGVYGAALVEGTVRKGDPVELLG